MGLQRYRYNPLKPKVFQRRIERLLQMGLEKDVAYEITTDFNGRHNDPTHALYILDWWEARLAFEAWMEHEYDRDYDIIQRYAYRYHIDPHELELEGVFDLQNYHTLRHFAHTAINNPYFRLAWPGKSYPLYHLVREPRSKRWGNVPYDIVQVRNHDAVIEPADENKKPIPAIRFVTGSNAANSQYESEKIAKDKIWRLEPTSSPSSLITFLKEMEESQSSSRFFEPTHHDAFLEFGDYSWVIIHALDNRKEALSLGDCGRPENRDTILISLREKVTDTHYQAHLKAEIVFPSNTLLSDNPEMQDLIKGSNERPGVLVQLRGYRNTKPAMELHKYIQPLLSQGWIKQIVNPNYHGQGYFKLSDLSVEDRALVRDANSILSRPKTFYKHYGNLSYPRQIMDKLVDAVLFPPQQIIDTLRRGKSTVTNKKRMIMAIHKRLKEGNRRRKRDLIAAILYAVPRRHSLLMYYMNNFKGYSDITQQLLDHLAESKPEYFALHIERHHFGYSNLTVVSNWYLFAMKAMELGYVGHGVRAASIVRDEQKLQAYIRVTEALLAYPTYVTEYSEYSLSQHDKYNYELLQLTSQFIELLSHPEVWQADIRRTPEMEIDDVQQWLTDNINSVIRNGLHYAIDRVISMPLTKTSFQVLHQIMELPFDPEYKFVAFERILDRMRHKDLGKKQLRYLQRIMIQLLDLVLDGAIDDFKTTIHKTRMILGATNPTLAAKIKRLVELYEMTGETAYMKAAGYFLSLLETKGSHIGPTLRKALKLQLSSPDPGVRNAAGEILKIPSGPNYKPRRRLRRRNPRHFG